jgi:16S rRNA (guanine(966)-N(2))-methyltransferase RsmD
VRIVSGKYKGRRFNPPKNLPVRPTTDFAKEGLFNILQHRFQIEGNRILDLFAGTGNMSLEFASRGADQVLSVDQDRKCIQFIEAICKQLQIDTIQCQVLDSEKYLKKCSGSFDLIFADPPYAYRKGIKLWELICERQLLKENGFFILEHGKDQEFESESGFLLSRKFGNVNFTFFQQES